MVGFRPDDLSGLMENSVFNHLQIQGHKVKTGQFAQGSAINFIADEFEHGVATVRLNWMWGFIKVDGTWWSNGRFMWVEVKKKWGKLENFSPKSSNTFEGYYSDISML